MANAFPAPSFGTSVSSGYSPKTPKIYQPIPMIGQPSFGAPYGRPQTPSQHNRHSSYTKGVDADALATLQPSVERVRRHREYYLDGGDIIFLVENYLFRVHRYFFERESPVFRKQLADSAHAGHHRIGSSDTDPMVLHDVRTEDFNRFLWVFYNPYYSIYEASTEDWAAILGLAHHWQFSEVKALVIRELEKQIIPSITKIVIYHRYGVDRNLLLPSYMDLCQREYALDFEEAKDLGLETTLMLMQAREVVRKGDGSISAHQSVSQDDLKHIIRQIFRFPEPRSDTPMSEDTVAENSPSANTSELKDQNLPLERPSDLPHIKTDPTTSAEVGSETPAVEPTNEGEPQPPVPPKTPNDVTDPSTPVVASRPISPTAGQSVPPARAKRARKQGRLVVAAAGTKTGVAKKHEVSRDSSAMRNGGEMDVAGDAKSAEVAEERKDEQGIYKMETGPGDDTKNNSQQVQEPSGGVDAPTHSTSDDIDMACLVPLLADGQDEKKGDSGIPRALSGADEAGAEFAATETSTTATETDTTIAIPQVAATDIFLPKLGMDIISVPDTTSTTENITIDVVSSNDAPSIQLDNTVQVALPALTAKKDEEEGENLMAVKQRLAKEKPKTIEPPNSNGGENLLDLSGEITPQAPTVIGRWNEKTNGSNQASQANSDVV